jgi:hypothetical protein
LPALPAVGALVAVAVAVGAGAAGVDEPPPPHPLTANAAIAMPTNPRFFIELLLQNERGKTRKTPP